MVISHTKYFVGIFERKAFLLHEKMFIINKRHIAIKVSARLNVNSFSLLFCQVAEQNYCPYFNFQFAYVKGNHQICINGLVKSEKTNCVLLFLVHIFPLTFFVSYSYLKLPLRHFKSRKSNFEKVTTEAFAHGCSA